MLSSVLICTSTTINYNMHLDVNECEVLNGGCDHRCKNTNGSYVCQCNKGFFLDGNGKSCSGKLYLTPFQPNVAFYVEISYLNCTAQHWAKIC